MNVEEITTDEIRAGLVDALRTRDLELATHLLALLATREPALAEVLYVAITGKTP